MAEATGGIPSQNGSTFRRVYEDTTYFIDGIVQEYGVFPAILEMMRDGNASIELKKRYLLRAIDETWVNIIEDTLPALDTIIRTPSRYIETREEVLPIELSRNISVRSLQHLCQHTNLISKIEGDQITPSKILNEFREETIQTYENKFINTLINRLYAFVNRRYEIARSAGQDEKTTRLEFKEDFNHEKVKVNMHFSVEISESADDESDRVERNYTTTTDLWHRVQRLNSIVTTYAQSDFVKSMGQSYIRPPVMRTNAILKNKNLRQCLTLWQFIETYEGAGYGMIVQENLEDVDEGYIKELYSTLALQYLIFRYNIHNEFEADNTLASNMTENVLNPRIVDRLDAVTAQEFDVSGEKIAPPPAVTRYRTLTPDDRLILRSLDVALDAADILAAREDDRPLEHAFVPEPDPVPVVPQPPEEQPEEETAQTLETAQAEPAAAEQPAEAAKQTAPHFHTMRHSGGPGLPRTWRRQSHRQSRHASYVSSRIGRPMRLERRG